MPRAWRTCCPPLQELLNGRVLVAHNAPFDRRVLRRAFELIGLEWPNPPVLCTAALARKLLPLQSRRGLGVLADALGIEVDTAHRALADAETCARVLCALFPRLCANALTIADAVAITGRRRRRTAVSQAARPGPDHPAAARLRRPSEGSRCLPVPRRRGPGPVRRQVDLDPQPGPRPLRALERAGRLDGAGHRGRLPEHELGARGARAREPPDQAPPPARQHPPRQARRAALLHPLPAGHPVPDPRGGLGARRRTRGHDRAAAGPAPGPGAGRAARLAVRPASLRASPPAPRASVGLRPDGALPVSLPGRSGPEPVPAPAGRGAAAVRRPAATAASGCWPTCGPRCARRRTSSSTSGPPGCVGACAVSGSCSSAWVARSRPPTPASRLVLAAHPVDATRQDAFWLVGGRLVDWGPGPAEDTRRARGAHAMGADPGRARRRARCARPARRDRRAADHRQLSGGAPGHPAGGARAERPSRRRSAKRQLDDLARSSSPPAPTETVEPGGASRRTKASAIGPRRGDSAVARHASDRPAVEAELLAGLAPRPQPQPAQLAVGLAAVEQPRDGLLAHVAALGERHRALVEPRLLGDHGVVEVDPVAGPPALDAQALGGRLAHRQSRRPPRARLAARSVSPRRTGDPRPRRCGSRAPGRRRRDRDDHVRVLLGRQTRRRRPASAASGPISDSMPRSSVRLCSSTW